MGEIRRGQREFSADARRPLETGAGRRGLAVPPDDEPATVHEPRPPVGRHADAHVRRFWKVEIIF
jgi:hypothetical protein